MPMTAEASRPANCKAENVTIDKNWTLEAKGKFVYLRGTLSHNCPTAVGVELTWTGYYADGSVAFNRNFWPNSTSNIPSGTKLPFETMNPMGIPIDRASLSVKNVRTW